MGNWFRLLDGLLRGERTSRASLASGRVDLPLRKFVMLALVLGAMYGFFMGWYAVARTMGTHLSADGWMQLLASTLKIPSLFLFTMVVTFPSLYVFNALMGCRLDFSSTMRLLIGAVTVNLAVAASFGPIIGFFTLSTKSYSFMVLLSVILLAIAGLVGLGFLLRALQRLAEASITTTTTDVRPRPPGVIPPESQAELLHALHAESPSERVESRESRADQLERAAAANRIFYVWMIIYGLVGAQMGWLLRPFVGNPGMPFSWFRERGGNIFESIVQHMGRLFGSE